MESLEQSWLVRGCYANWKLTVTAEPPEGCEVGEDGEAPSLDVPRWPDEKFQFLANQFAHTVNHYEAVRELEQVRWG
ncbi:hypothetical protein [Amycolatopsis nigrescens]|uniref:hypothetical protein n=1 Tax=Amycolatopsis nigrescens TaxID=381445 RepID=UPI00037A0249|nr:hypothetical protein [Amycolatopsis nigrescens]